MYLEPDDATFYAAISSEGEVVGSIAVVRYDERLEETRGFYDGQSTAEIVKCYVDAKRRRQGIGAELVREALHFCREAGYENAYLHTHRFLPGVVTFWEQQGFEIKCETKDALETIHMDRKIGHG